MGAKDSAKAVFLNTANQIEIVLGNKKRLVIVYPAGDSF
jgi:hypothetical protein